MSSVPVYLFTCSTCGEDIYLNDGMRERLIEAGCVVCGNPVSPEDFTRT